MAFNFGKFMSSVGPSLASGVTGGLFGMLNGAINYNQNKKLMALQNQYAQDNMLLSNELNKEFQNFVWKNEIPMNVAAMKQAGLNPAGASTSLSGAGNVGNSLVSSSPSSHPSDFDLLNGVTAFTNLNLLKEQVEGLRLDNERKAIDNRNLRDEDDYLRTDKNEYYVNPETDELLTGTQLFEWRQRYAQGLEEHLPMLVVTPKNSKGIMSAREFAASNKANIKEATARELQSTFDIDVNKARLSPKLKDIIINTIATLPVSERKKLNEEITSLNLENKIKQFDIDNVLPNQLKMLELNLDEQRLTTFAGLINTLKSEEIDGWEKFLAAIGFAIKTLSGTHISIPGRNSK